MQSSLESMAVHFHQNPLLHQHLQQQHRLQPTTTATLTSTTASVSVTIKAPTSRQKVIESTILACLASSLGKLCVPLLGYFEVHMNGRGGGGGGLFRGSYDLGMKCVKDTSEILQIKSFKHYLIEKCL